MDIIKPSLGSVNLVIIPVKNVKHNHIFVLNVTMHHSEHSPTTNVFAQIITMIMELKYATCALIIA